MRMSRRGRIEGDGAIDVGDACGTGRSFSKCWAATLKIQRKEAY